jgi:hypothetical protein
MEIRQQNIVNAASKQPDTQQTMPEVVKSSFSADPQTTAPPPELSDAQKRMMKAAEAKQVTNDDDEDDDNDWD